MPFKVFLDSLSEGALITILAAVFFIFAVAVFAALTAEKWLLFLLNRMDLALTKIGFGKWSARALTAAEEWFRKRRERREINKKRGG